MELIGIPLTLCLVGLILVLLLAGGALVVLKWGVIAQYLFRKEEPPDSGDYRLEHSHGLDQE